MAHLTHNDSPTDTDAFGQQAFIDAIAESIQNCTPPKGIGLNGYWGTGKTSSLMQLKAALEKEAIKKDVLTVWFEAWRYQHETTPIVALLHEIRSAFSKWEQAKEQTKKIAGITLLGVLSAFDKTIEAASGGMISPKMGDLSKIGADYEKERYQNLLPSEDIRQHLKDAIDAALGNEKDSNKKLVILIDDLDRCNPEAALKLLEGIKIYLNLNNCVTVFAIDQRQIEQALEKALKVNDAREYLEKICQDIYHLPLPDKMSKAKYLDYLLKDLVLHDKSVIDDAEIIKIQDERRIQIKKVTATFDCLPANPRKIKALANRIAIILRNPRDVLSKNNNPLQGEYSFLSLNYVLLIAMAIIYTFHREINEQLAKNPEFIGKVMDYASDADGLEPAFKEPMKFILPSKVGDRMLPTNPSDSNVFRLHELFKALDVLSADHIKPFIGI